MLPNFLVVGAAKAGTTSIYKYLEQHPDVYMSPVKEPKFLTSHALKFPHKGPGDPQVDAGIIRDLNSYKALFTDVDGQKAVGEASADNLYYYDIAIPNIKKHLKEVRIIAILRNPVGRAYSAYLHLVRDQREELSFEEALEAEDYRRRDNWEFIWFYKDVGLYYSQIKAYIDAFGRDRVKIYLFENLKADPVALVQDIYRFLGVDDTFVPQIKRYNVSGVPKSKLLHEFLRRPSIVKSVVKHLIPATTRKNLVLELQNRNLKKPEMRPETRKRLIEVYRDDIKRLEKLIGRDLSSWLT